VLTPVGARLRGYGQVVEAHIVVAVVEVAWWMILVRASARWLARGQRVLFAGLGPGRPHIRSSLVAGGGSKGEGPAYTGVRLPGVIGRVRKRCPLWPGLWQRAGPGPGDWFVVTEHDLAGCASRLGGLLGG